MEKLQATIQAGDIDNAALLAKDLAMLANRRGERGRCREDFIKIKVRVFELDHTIPFIFVKVKPSYTVFELKLVMRYEHGLPPPSEQIWIVGRTVLEDERVLLDCGILQPDFEAYLYLKVAHPKAEITLDPYDMWNAQQPIRRPTSFVDGPLMYAPLLDAGDHVDGAPPVLLEAPSSSNNWSGGQWQESCGDSSNIRQAWEASVFAREGLLVRVPSETSSQLSHRLSPVPSNVCNSSAGAGIEDKPVAGWECTYCTFFNESTHLVCSVCEAHPKEMSSRNFAKILSADMEDLVGNTEVTTCPICFCPVNVGEGVVLHECLHSFCRLCLEGWISHCTDAAVSCPYKDDVYSCSSLLLDRELKALAPQLYEAALQRSLDLAEAQAPNSFHCKTVDCSGWCIYDDDLNFFDCPVCRKRNCLTCKAIHEGQNCKQYQDDLRARAANDLSARETQEMLRRLLASQEAMECPGCRIIILKKDGCDWIKCSICKTELCWVTKMPRWGPGGPNDISGGCQCQVNGKKCHPKCCNCH